MRKTIKINLRIFFILVSLILALSSCLKYNKKIKLTKDEKKWLKENADSITVAPAPNWRPFEFIDNSGSFDGFSFDYLNLLEKKLDIKFKIVTNDNWSENIEQFKAGKVQLLPSVAPTIPRKAYMDFTIPYYTVSTGIFVRNDSHKNYTLDELIGNKIAVTKGYAIHDYILANYPQIDLTLVQKPQEGILKLSNGEVDAFLVIPAVALYYIDKNKINNLRFAGNSDFSYTLSMGIQKDNHLLESILNKGIASINDQTKNELLSKWGSPNISSTKSDIHRHYIIFILIAITLASFTFYLFFKKRLGILNSLFIFFIIALILIFVQNFLLTKESQLLTKEEITWLQNNKNIVFSPCPDYPPIDFINAEGKYSGISKSILNIIEDKIDYKFKIEHIAAWNQLLKKLENKETDFISAVQKTKARSNYAVFTSPYMEVRNVLITKKDDPQNINLDNFTNHKVAVIKDYAVSSYLRKEYPNFDFLEVSTVLEGLLKVSFGDLDGLIADLPTAVYNIEKEGISNLIAKGEIDYSYQISFGIRNDWPILRNIFNKALADISQRDKQKIIKEWIFNNYTQFWQTEQFWNIFIITVFSLLFFTYLLFNWRKNIIELNTAKAAVKAKNEFLANISHEIRTPINAIIGFTELLNDEAETDNLKDYAANIKNSGTTLLTLINDILDLSKIEAEKIKLKNAPTNLRKIVNEVKSIFSYLIQEKELDLIIDIPQSLPKYLILDEVKIRQILLNLVGNAVKFTSEGFVKIEIYTKKNFKHNFNLVIKIQDSGIGIPKNQQKIIFESFQQRDDIDISEYGGTGLGLAITKKLISSMQGDISVKSEIGKGSSFIIKLDNVVKADKYYTRKEDEIIFTPEKHKFPETVKTLTIENNSTDKILLKKYLTPFDTKIYTANNLNKETLFNNQKLNLDLLIVNDLESLLNETAPSEKKKLLDKLKTIPIINITSTNDWKIDESTSDLSIVSLRKPFTRNDLMYNINKLIPLSLIKNKGTEIKTENFKIDKINPVRLKEIIKKLETDFLPAWMECNDSFIISDIKIFTSDVSAFAKKNKLDFLKIWAAETKKMTLNYDMEKLPDHFGKFPNLINKFKINNYRRINASQK